MAGDPVAEKSAFLRMYMSSHPETLVAYAKYYGKVKTPVISAEMTDISTKTMTLLCKLKSGEKQSTTVVFSPPLSGYEDVKPRLLEMKSIAQEKLGMIQAPSITSFELPLEAYPAAVIICGTVFMYYFPEAKLVQPMSKVLGPTCILRLFQVTVIANALETLYTLFLCRQCRMSLIIEASYVMSTVFCGYTICAALKQRIQKVRIDSVMKVE